MIDGVLTGELLKTGYVSGCLQKTFQYFSPDVFMRMIHCP